MVLGVESEKAGENRHFCMVGAGKVFGKITVLGCHSPGGTQVYNFPPQSAIIGRFLVLSQKTREHRRELFSFHLHVCIIVPQIYVPAGTSFVSSGT
jgi:hypothetical protein